MKFTRRSFVKASAALGALSMIGIPSYGEGKGELTIKQVMDLILKSVPGAPFSNTVDVVKSSDANQRCTGVVTTMFATMDVIRKAIEIKANFIVVHEPTYYNHTDSVDWLANDPVYTTKRALLEKNKIVVWRFHDYIHSMEPDGVLFGVVSLLGWEKYYNAGNPTMVKIPSMTVGEIVSLSKSRLGISKLRIVGDLSQPCERVALLPGAWGGRRQIELQTKEKPDLMMVGEISEWETAEYIRDARAQGEKRSLIILGHALSEEPGMKWMAPWLQRQVPELSVTHIPCGEPFTWV